jgi:hypothetical protein
VRGSIVRRGAKWAVIVDVERDAKGGRKQRWHSGYRTKRDASRALTEILASLQAGAYVEPSKQTVAGFMREWLDATKATVRPSTWVSYRLMVESHIVPGLGAVPLQQLAPSMLNAFYAELLMSGRRDGVRSPRRCIGSGLRGTSPIRLIHLTRTQARKCARGRR